MSKPFLYPFQDSKVSLIEILQYYRKKGLDVNKSQLYSAIKEVSNQIGRENITEEIFLNIIKKVLSQKTLATVDSNFKANCIEEFGQEFWDDLLARKKVINKNRSFRNSMKVTTSNQYNIANKSIIGEERTIGKKENESLLKNLQEKNSEGNEER